MANGQNITNNGKIIILDRTYTPSPTRSAPSQFKIGYGTTTPTITDTALANDYPLSGTESVDDCEATTGWVDSADMTVSLNNTTFKENAGALNLTKDGTGSASASTSKTTTSRDFTSKEFHMWLYIDDATVLAQLATTDALTIRFGSSSGNYSQWTKDKADLVVGWNYIDVLTISNRDSETGTHDVANSDFTLIQLTATGSGETWASGKIIMDDIRVVSSDDFLKTFVSGFPSIDIVSRVATIRGIVLTTEANNQDLTEFGTFNTDGTPLMFSRAVFTAITKNSGNQITIIEKNTFA